MSNGNTFLLAQMAFGRARAKAMMGQLWATIQRRPNRLLAYEEVRKYLHPGGQVYRGLRAVPISQIVGSVDRYRDFDRAFLPRQTHTEARWESVGRAYFDQVNLPPIKLYKIGEAYFVVDGNHRVSVARELGQEFIDAEVREVHVRVPLTPDVDPRSLEIIGEKSEFLTETRLDELRPGVEFSLTIPGGYGLLLEHIGMHRYLQSVEWNREFGLEEAATQWCDQVYTPMVQAIRQSRILRDFPGHTVGDLYIWLIEHQYFLQERYHSRISALEVARSFTDQFTAKIVKRFWHWLLRRVLKIEPDISRLD
jgi:hypothetical protein